jgi:hypothetical protein
MNIVLMIMTKHIIFITLYSILKQVIALFVTLFVACYWHEQSNDLNYNFRNVTEKSETEFNIVELDTVHGHKYSSPSIFYYCIFHIKPHFFKKIF